MRKGLLRPNHRGTTDNKKASPSPKSGQVFLQKKQFFSLKSMISYILTRQSEFKKQKFMKLNNSPKTNKSSKKYNQRQNTK